MLLRLYTLLVNLYRTMWNYSDDQHSRSSTPGPQRAFGVFLENIIFSVHKYLTNFIYNWYTYSSSLQCLRQAGQNNPITFSGGVPQTLWFLEPRGVVSDKIPCSPFRYEVELNFTKNVPICDFLAHIFL